MTATPRLSLPLLAAGQAQKHVTHNDALVRLDGLIHLAAASRSQATPPAAPDETSAYLIPANGSGVFAGRADQLALFEDGGWTFLSPRKGWQCWIEDEAELHVWTGLQWRRASPQSAEGTSLWGVNATADATTRLAVSAQASLFNHQGGGHQLKLNKAAPSDTAALLFQDGFSGRAEIGLAGDDDLRIKVSADGASWREALVIDRASGRVQLPATPWAGDRAQPNLLINGDFQVDQRGFAGGALAAGVYGFDRWKAGNAGAALTLAGFTIGLNTGAIVQIVEPGLWGLASFTGLQLTLSIENLTGGALTVGLGSQSGAIAPGQGRRALTLTPAAGDAAALTLRLAPAAGAVTFGRIKLELGTADTGWPMRSLADEERLCRRYYWRAQGVLLIDAYQAAAGTTRQDIPFPARMRTTPTPSFASAQEINLQDRAIVALSPERAYATVTAAALGRVRAAFDAVSFDAEL